VYEILGRDAGDDIPRLASTIKRLPLRLLRPRPLAEAISSAGGVRLEALDDALMVRSLPGVFCAGEMLDWEAPTGGYLLAACFASGRRAGLGAVGWLRSHATAGAATGSAPDQNGNGSPSSGEANR
jgi:predicted flavoprotein YhiN